MYGQKIKTKRQALHMSQEDLARELNLTRQAISKWEMDKAQPTMANLRELSRVFGVDMAYFIGENKKPNEESTAAGIFWWALYSIYRFRLFCDLLFRHYGIRTEHRSEKNALPPHHTLYDRRHDRLSPSLSRRRPSTGKIGFLSVQ